jgi:hypothetical protein
MNYLKSCAERVLISINGYKTPKKVMKLIKKNDLSYLVKNPPWQGTTT